ncbi:L,D-transpeptidase family protein [Pseudochelatococcus sp. B33]
MARVGRIGEAGRGRASRATLSGAAAVAVFMSLVTPTFAGSPPAASPAAPGVDPVVTGSIDSRVDMPRPPGSIAVGEDSLLPSTAHYSVKEEPAFSGALNEIGMPLPGLPPPVDIPAPDLTTLIGVRLLGDENTLGSTLPRLQREAVVRAYEQRGFAPFWIEDGAWNAAARAALDVLADADTHGLSPARYAVPAIVPDRLEALAGADTALSVAVAGYARDARGARIDRNKIGALAMPKLDLPEADAVLEAVFAAGDKADEALSVYHPRAPQYYALRQKLIELRGGRERTPAPMARVPDGPTITIGMRDERVPLIRARLGLTPADDEEDARVYSARLAEVVAEFQKEHGLPGNGALNRRTVLALAGVGDAAVPVGRVIDTARLEAAIRVNMERWRWFPHDLGERHVLVNIPEQDVKVVEAGRTIHRTRGVIGKLATPTPVFSDVMAYIVLNPSWYVPPSILKSEFLPGLARDPQYAARRGYEVIRQGNTISVRQPPGASNALGRVKFMFPNDLAIYLHDTPNRGVFQRKERALSNGCIRVENPMKLAEVVVGNGWTEDRLSRQIGGRERSLRLETPLPIHLTYFTLTVDSEGKISTLPDVYGYDQRLKAALDGFDKKGVGL